MKTICFLEAQRLSAINQRRSTVRPHDAAVVEGIGGGSEEGSPAGTDRCHVEKPSPDRDKGSSS